MLYLVSCEIVESRYMQGTETFEKIYIVEAENEEQVTNKVRKFYEDKDDPYYASYWVNFNYINEAII